MADIEIAGDDVQELDRITKRFKRVMLLINCLIILMVVWLLLRAVSPKLKEAMESVQVSVMTAALVLLAIVHGYSLRMTQVQDVERIRYLTLRDGLTHAYNLRFLNQSIDQEVQRSARFGHPFSLLYIDLDGFKQVNDTHGHAAGDKVLIEVSNVLSRTCRATDVVGRVSSVVGRIGGDEFLVLLPETLAPGAEHLAQRLIRRVRGLSVIADGVEVAKGIGASVGIVSFPSDGLKREELVEKADAAMYRAKQEGGSCYCDASGVVVKPLGEEKPDELAEPEELEK